MKLTTTKGEAAPRLSSARLGFSYDWMLDVPICGANHIIPKVNFYTIDSISVALNFTTLQGTRLRESETFLTIRAIRYSNPGEPFNI